MGYAFVQEAYLSHQLSQQALVLRQQNAAIQAQNGGYSRDIQALMSGAGSEEQARLNGYARSDEKVYLVGAPPASAQRRSVVPKSSGAGGVGIVEAIRRWLGNL